MLTSCPCCPPDVRAERITLNLPPCRGHAAERLVGLPTFEHKTAPALTIGTRADLSRMSRGDRRRDKRFRLG